MSVLVIGGTGFIGRFIVENLIEAEVNFTVLTRNEKKIDLFSKKVSYIIGDLLDPASLELSPYNQFINCAGEIHNEDLMEQLHIESIVSMLNKIKPLKNAHWIQISSVGVYGKIKSGVVDEDYPFAPVGQYETTKADGELLIKKFCLEHKINYTIIRPSTVFGCGMPNQSLLQLISTIRKKMFVYIGKPSTNVVMNYVPVQDVANFVLCCLNNKAALNQDFIISDQLFLSEFVQIISRELKIKNSFYYLPEWLIRFFSIISRCYGSFPITASRVDALTTKVIYSTEKAKYNLGFSPSVGLARGLKEYVAYLNNR